MRDMLSTLDIEIIIIIGVKKGTSERQTEAKISACLRNVCYV